MNPRSDDSQAWALSGIAAPPPMLTYQPYLKRTLSVIKECPRGLRMDKHDPQPCHHGQHVLNTHFVLRTFDTLSLWVLILRMRKQAQRGLVSCPEPLSKREEEPPYEFGWLTPKLKI